MMTLSLPPQRCGWALWFVLCSAVVCPASSSLVFAVRTEARAAAVVVGGHAVVRVRHRQTAVAVARARVIAARLNEQAEAGLSAAALSLQLKPGLGLVYAEGDLLCTATAEAAKAAGSTPKALAESWLGNLKEVFSRPYLSVPAPDAIPLGESLGLPLRGNPEGAAVEFAGPDELAVGGRAETKLNDSKTGFALTGRQLGPLSLTLRRAGAELTLKLSVKRRAGRVVGPVTATVCGLYVPREMAEAAIWSALERATERQPGVALQFRLPSRLSTPGPNQAVRVPVAVTLAGGETIPFAETIDVTLREVDWADTPADRLMVSNEPENVAATQLLLRGQLPAGQLTRLLYHHKTTANVPLRYEIRLLNQGDAPARVLVRDAVSGPNGDEIFVGHQACLGFWRQRLNHQGYSLELPARSSWTILSRQTSPGDVLSGLSEFSVQQGEDVEVQVVATSGGPQLGPRAIVGPTTAAPSDIFIFPQPCREVAALYRPGGMYAFVNVGREPVRSLRETPLLGNYGVIYNIELTFENTADVPQRYELVFSADGGVARGVLVLDGKLRQTGLVRPSQQEQLLGTRLLPGGVEKHTIRIMPQSGSNYPLRLIGRPFRPELSRGARP